MDDDIKYPICPLNMYYEGDENTCNEEGCDYDLSTRSCLAEKIRIIFIKHWDFSPY